MSDEGDPLEARMFAWVFGDDDEDPGLIAEEAARRPESDAWLTRIADDYGFVKSALRPEPALGPHALARPTGLVQARVAALRDDIAKRRAGAVDWSAARADNVRSLAAARPTRTRRVVIGVALVFAAAAAVLLATRGGAAPAVDAQVAGVLLRDVAVDPALGFGGAAPPSAHDRGFILGAVIDLSRARADAAPRPAADLALARDLADRALAGLPAPDDAEARRQRAISGCAAILVDAGERAACERGLADYIQRRDAFFAK